MSPLSTSPPAVNPLDPHACYGILQARDPRFDGRLFVGVTSTGIYCRPVCPARTPRFENCRFYLSAAAAQEAGFRPCLRCRPEAAPDLGAGQDRSKAAAADQADRRTRNETLRLLIDRLGTPIGELVLVADDAGRLRALDWTDYDDRLQRLLRLHYGEHGFRLEPARDPGGLSTAMRAYFAGDLAAIDPLPVAIQGTPFQREVWQALRDIPCGQTISYGTLARRIGRPAAVRAVGLANGANPVGIVVPCHRVVGSNGALTGYGGGIHRKRWLLAHEQRAGASPELPLTGT